MNNQKKFSFLSGLACSLVLLTGSAYAQTPAPPIAVPKPTPKPTAPRIPDPPEVQPNISREQRAQAYAKLLEGQRHLLMLDRIRSQIGTVTSGRAAREALTEAVRLNPYLAEGYTALAELTLILDPREINEGLRLANIATRLNADNIGGHRLAARLLTVQSGVYETRFDRALAEKSAAEWREVVRLDPKNAEGWAFLSDIYKRLGNSEQEIGALQNWIGASTPTEPYFYMRLSGSRDLSVTSANQRLGASLVDAGRISEAISALNQSIADDPQNSDAIDLLSKAVALGSDEDAARAIESLQQAVFAQPTNTELIQMLARTQARAGRLNDALKTLDDGGKRLGAENKDAQTALAVAAAEIYAGELRDREAVAAYENALNLQGIGNAPTVTETQKDFAAQILPRLLTIYKNADRAAEAKAVIQRMRAVLGKDDPSADIQNVQLLREQGNKNAALLAVRAARQKFSEEISLLQLEANILNDSGRTNEAVALWNSKISKNSANAAGDTVNKFIAYLNISALYGQVQRGAEAVKYARDAVALAETSNAEPLRKTALKSLANAYYQSKNYAESDQILTQIIKENPNDAEALNNYGYYLVMRNERLPEAAKMIERAVKIEPTNANYLDSLGWAYFRMGDAEQAEKYIMLAVRRDPTSATSQDHLGDIYEKTGRSNQARSAWQRALTLAVEPSEIARIKTKLGDAKKN